ncbi:MAG: hypothetical protein ACYCZB_17995 [Acidiphilium sp.]
MRRGTTYLPLWLQTVGEEADTIFSSDHADTGLLLSYAYNVIRRVEPSSDEAEVVVGWLARHRQRLKLAAGLFTPADADRGERRRHGRPIGAARWKALGDALRAQIGGRRRAIPSPALEAGLAAVVAALGLETLDAALFRLVYRYMLDNRFERLFDGLANAQGRPSMLRRYPDLFALLIGGRPAEINARFRADAPLLACGAVRLDEEGGIKVPSRGDRLSDLLLAQRIGVDAGDALYLFDEAEDLFRPRAFDREPDPKIFVHRLLETAKVPMIWAANDIEAFSPAVLRRMTQCIEVRLPPQARRAELWREGDAERLLTELAAETEGRDGAPRPVGFGR